MRNMSFALTTAQVLAHSKDVTRRLGWEFLKVGDFLQPVKKCMGLRAGERIERIGGAIQVVSLKRERLDRMTTDLDYGWTECVREGFGDHPSLKYPSEFVLMFCNTHRGCTPATVVTRIEFRYMPEQA